MGQYEAITGRKPKISYADIVTAQTPGARNRYFNDRSYGLAKSGQEQANSQFDEGMALQQEQMAMAAEQAKQQQQIATGGLALAAAPYAKDLYNYAAPKLGIGNPTPTPASPVAPTPSPVAAPPTTPMVNPGPMTDASALIEGGLASLPSTGGYEVASALTPYGSWSAEPASSLFIGGEGGTLASGSAPLAAEGYSTGAGTTGASTGMGGVAAGAGAAIAAQQLYDSAPISGKIKDTYKIDLTPDSVGEILVGPIPGTSDVADWVDTQVDDAGDWVADRVGTHFCTAIKDGIGVSEDKMAMMNIFRKWCQDNHPEITGHYMANADKVVSSALDKTMDKQAFLADLREVVVDSVINAMVEDDMPEAYRIYWDKYLSMIEEFRPDLFPGLSKMEVPNA